MSWIISDFAKIDAICNKNVGLKIHLANPVEAFKLPAGPFVPQQFLLGGVVVHPLVEVVVHPLHPMAPL